MPTTYRPQLDHVGFDWIVHADQIDRALRSEESLILEKLGFNDLFGDHPAAIFKSNAEEVMRELSGILSLAASIRMDAGFKAPNKLISIVRAIKKEPSIIFNRAVEPEALASVGSHYQRAGEPPGRFWWDIDKQFDGPLLDLQRVRDAASAAISALQAEAHPGKPIDEVTKFLSRRGRELFLQYNPAITRHSVASSRNGKACQVEAGRFLEFLELWLSPLNTFFSTLSKDYCPTPVSPAGVARMAVELEPRPTASEQSDPAKLVSPSTQLNP